MTAGCDKWLNIFEEVKKVNYENSGNTKTIT
jgi:hypothetical protein